MKPLTVQVYDGEWIRPVMSGAREECCGCGLRHDVTYRVRDRRTGGILGGVYVEYRAKRVDSKWKR